MNTSKAKRIARVLTVLTLLFITIVSLSTPQKVRAQSVCSPATAVSVPYAKDGVADICVQTTTLCSYINSWGLATLEINGTSYVNSWASGSSIPPLNGVFTIHYVSTNASGHFEISAPCTGPTATNTPVGPTATFTRTPTRTLTPTNTPVGPTATFTRTPTRTNTPTATSAGTTNLAQGKTITSDSSQSSNPVTNGNDGSTSTRWCANDANTNHWVMVDLGASSALTSSEVMWESAVNYKYKVEVSTDSTNWTMAVDKTANTSTAQTQTDAFSATARYVRITVTGLSSGSWASFFEFRVFGAGGGGGPTATPTKTATPTRTATPGSGSGTVSTYGRLQISNAQLKASNGTAIQLAGMSSHGLTWFPLIDLNLNNTTNMNAFKQQITFNPTGGSPFPYTSSLVGNLVDQMHMQVIRTSMFPFDPWNGADAKSYDNNYPEWKWYNINLVNAIVQSAINENIYVIIDWHAGEGGDPDPNIYWNNGHAQEFFTYMVDKWGSYPNVIYETVNSPVIGWTSGLKTYNQNVINHIRSRETANGYAANLILVGTPTWSQDVDVATASPLTGNLILYNYMWYAGTHFSWVQSRGDTALANLAANAPNQALFMGEVGTSTSDGNGGVYYSNFNTLMEWAKTKKLSWLNWSIANKQESSAIFVPAILGNMINNEIAWRGGDGASIAQAMASTGQPMRIGPWNDADYSCSGKFIKGWMLYNTSQSTPSGC